MVTVKTFIFDWKRTLYDPEHKQLIAGAVQLLAYLAGQSTSVLVGKGDDTMRQEVERLGVGSYFSAITFEERAKESSLYIKYVDTERPENTIFIGDRTRSELAVGNQLHARTMWVRQGKFRDEKPENPVYSPTYAVNSLKEALAVIKQTELLNDAM